jgi:hypothetical protein
VDQGAENAEAPLESPPRDSSHQVRSPRSSKKTAEVCYDGTILDQLPPYQDVTELVLVRGLQDASGKRIDPERAALAGRLAKALLSDSRMVALVSELDVTAGADSVGLTLREPQLTLMVTESSMMERLLEVLPLLTGIVERLPEVELIDLRFRNRVFLRVKESVPGENPPSTAIVPGGASF